MSEVQLTILNTMADRDFETALDRHVEWGLEVLDLKDSIFGRSVCDLSLEEARRAAWMIQERGLSVHCLSTTLFDGYVEDGEQEFRQNHLRPVQRTIEVAQILKPRLIRLIAARTRRRQEIGNGIEYVSGEFPWLLDQYREAIGEISGSGFRATIENETGGCLLSAPDEVLALFQELDADGDVSFTWDVVNLWQAGTFPSLNVYETLRPLIGYYHAKGGRCEPGAKELRWKSTLEDASWPVAEITRRVIEDGTSPVICINPPKGRQPDGEDGSGTVLADLSFLRNLIDESNENREEKRQ